jgi:hypothetical protein
MTPVGFEPTISAVEGPQTYALDRVLTGIGLNIPLLSINKFCFNHSACPVILNTSTKTPGNIVDHSLLHRYRFHLCTVQSGREVTVHPNNMNLRLNLS